MPSTIAAPTTRETSRSSDRLAPLTSARFFAALAIVVHHGGGPLFAGAPEWLRSIHAFGHVAVRFFFVLSGFVLALKYADPVRVPRIDTPRFWLARLARIYPMYLIAFILFGMVAVSIFGPAFPHRHRHAEITSLLLVQSWWLSDANVWNFPAWSLSDEAFFYLVFPFAILPLRRDWRGFGLVLAMLLLWATELVTDGMMSSIPSPVSRLPEFLLGAVLGRAFLWEREREIHRSGSFIAAAGVLGLFVLAALHTRLPLPRLHSVLAVLPLVLIVYGLAHGSRRGRSFLSHPLLVLLGDASYSTYILQVPIALWLLVLLDRSPVIGRWSLSVFFAYAAILLVASVVALLVVERPVQRRLAGALARRK